MATQLKEKDVVIDESKGEKVRQLPNGEFTKSKVGESVTEVTSKKRNITHWF